MFSSDHFIHFVFDFYNETHYTDTLLALPAEAYVWYTLRQQHIDNALFLTENGSELKLGAYDADSAAMLKTEKKKFWGKSQSEADPVTRHSTFSLSDVGEDAQSLLGWLLDKQESQRYRRVALVVTLDAFLTLFQKAKDKDRQRLTKLCSRPAGRNLLLIRVPMTARDMSKAFLEPSSPLRQLCPGLNQVASGPKEPLMDALDRHLDRQIFHAYRLTEADTRGILLRHALVKGTWADSIRDLEDQAACLYGANLAKDRCSTRREVYESVQKEGAQEELRAKAAQFRQKYPRLTVAEAMLSEAPSMRGPTPLEWNSELAKNVRTLTLPEEFFKEYPKCSYDMDTIREDFRTVWNKPLNRTAYQAADSFCTEIRSAAKRQDWETLHDAVALLKFCGSELCTDTANDDGLTAICEEGKTIINMSYNQFLQQQAQDTFGGDHATDSIFASKINMMNQTQRKIAQATYESNAAQLQLMRSTLHNAMTDFGKRHVSQDVVAQFYKAAEQQMAQQMDDVMQTVSRIDPPAEKQSHTADFEFEEIPFEDYEAPKTPAAPPAAPKVYTAEDKEADKKAIDDLFDRAFF